MMYFRTVNDRLYQGNDLDVEMHNSQSDKGLHVKQRGNTVEELCDMVYARTSTNLQMFYDVKLMTTLDWARIRTSMKSGWFVEVQLCFKTETGFTFMAKLDKRGKTVICRLS